MKILVTGAKGTLGRPLVNELRLRGHEVICVDLKHEPDNIRCNISDYRQLFRIFWNHKDIELVYHLAAEFGRMNGEEYYEQVWETNAIGTKNILEIQRIFGFKLIFASSSEIYGDLHNDFLKEDDIPAEQSNDYAISKWVNEIQCRNAIKRYSNKIMILRFFNAYGPGEFYNDYRSVCSLFCYRALHGIQYQVYKNYHRVFMYIDDFIPTLANACDRFINGEVINIGGSEYRSVEELSDIVLSEVGIDDSIVVYMPEDKHNVVNKRPDITKSIKLLGHNPNTPLEEGIRKTIEWMKIVYKK